jgi:chemotaxis response regulator CheB
MTASGTCLKIAFAASIPVLFPMRISVNRTSGILEISDEIHVVGTGNSAPEAVKLYLQERPDVLLTDTRIMTYLLLAG